MMKMGGEGRKGERKVVVKLEGEGLGGGRELEGGRQGIIRGGEKGRAIKGER